MEDPFKRYQEALREGHSAALEGRPAQALKHYQQAARVADSRALPHVCIGGVLLRMGRLKQALEAYERALERAPDDPAALAGRAAALLANGRREEASAVLAHIAELERRSEQARREAALAASAAEIGAAEEASPLTRAEVLHVAGEHAWLAGRTEAALDAWLEAARAYADDDHLDAALDSAQRALLAAPGQPRVHLELSRLYLRHGWRETAVERLVLLGRLLELEPDPQLRAAVTTLAGQHRAMDPRLAALAGPEPSAGDVPGA